MKDIVTNYWLNYKISTIEFGDYTRDNKNNRPSNHALQNKFAIITIHDAAPEFSKKIFTQANELEKLNISFNFAVIPYFKEIEDNDMRSNTEFIQKLKDYHQSIALHGLYHEHARYEIEDFYNMKADRVRRNIEEGVQILKESGIKTQIFVPPTWAINKQTIDILKELRFTIVETVEEILILDKDTRLHSNILNWDTGNERADQVFIGINNMLYRKKVMQNVQLIRLAIHPRDPLAALKDQIKIITGLRDINYNFLGYDDIRRLFG